MCSARDNAALPALGCPIRESAGHRPFSASPRLIAAVHALHRLLVPRHPPCALTILTVIGSTPHDVDPVIPKFIGYCAVLKVRGEAGAPATEPRARGPRELAGGRRSLKTQQRMDALGGSASAPPWHLPGSVDIPRASSPERRRHPDGCSLERR